MASDKEQVEVEYQVSQPLWPSSTVAASMARGASLRHAARLQAQR